MNDKFSHFAIIKSDREEVKKKFLWLVYETSENDWGRKVAGEAWAAKEVLVHIVQVLEVLPKGKRLAVQNGKRSILSNVLSMIRSWVNGYPVIPILAKLSTR
jgi:hypothetical protein